MTYMAGKAKGISSTIRKADDSSPSAEGGKRFRVCGREISCLRARGGGFPIAPATPSARSLLN